MQLGYVIMAMYMSTDTHFYIRYWGRKEVIVVLYILKTTPTTPHRVPMQNLVVDGWKKKHARLVYIPAKICDLKSFVIINLQIKMLLIYSWLKHEVSSSQNNCIKLCSLYVM